MVDVIPDVAPPADAGTKQADYNLVGTSPAHHDFIQKVKGTLLYAADWKLPGMLHGKLVRSQIASGRITNIDTSEARALPGVVAVLTAEDIPNNEIIENASGGLGELTVVQPVLAYDRVRYTGEPIAIVAATDPEIAEEAADLVVVDYEDLPGVYDVEAASADGAPLVHDEGNVLVNWNIERGDVADAMSKADVIVEGQYESQHVEHAYLETEVGVSWLENDVVTMRVSTQVIEHATEIAHILGLPDNKVRVIASYMGGGFGGKEDMTVEAYIGLITLRTGRPARMIWSRQESLQASTKRHPFLMRYRSGVKKDGTIIAQEAEVLGDAGAYPALSARVLFAGAALACGPYYVPNTKAVSRAIFTNNVPTSAFRGFGAMQIVFGYESHIDRIAKQLGIDKKVIRDRNYYKKGDTIPNGETLTTAVAIKETRDAAIKGLGTPTPATEAHKRVGRGFGGSMQPYGRTIWFRDHASVWLTLQSDGSLLLRSGVTDLGAGQAASLCQIAAEVLGVPLDKISVYIGDTALNPPAGGTFATRQLYMSGNAILRTARRLREMLTPVAQDLLNNPDEELSWREGTVSSSNASVTLADLAKECEQRGVDTSNLYTWRAPSGAFDPETGQGGTFPGYTFGTHAADVEVDTETGEVRVLKYVASHDVGQQINPMRVQGQIQGGAMQGLGYALMEDCPADEGQPVSTLFANYLIPTAMDMPDIDVQVIESGEGAGPLNARGIGEPPIGPPAATIASAIEDAIGVRPTHLPFTPEKILALLNESEGSGSNQGNGDDKQ